MAVFGTKMATVGCLSLDLSKNKINFLPVYSTLCDLKLCCSQRSGFNGREDLPTDGLYFKDGT
jgi:hypothetical protein